MKAVGLKVLKNKLSEYVRMAEGGETILITDRDRVVAEMVPVTPGRSPWVDDANLAELVRKGWLTPPANPGGPIPKSHPIMTIDEVLRDLDEARSDREIP